MLDILNVKVESIDDLLTRGQINFISTGSKNLDTLLGGGIPTYLITEFHGEFGVGKTQIAHQLSVCVQLPEKKGGLSSPAIYIDTEGTFRPERLIKIAKYFGLNSNEVLKNVYVSSVRNLEQQNIIFQLLPSVVKEKSAKLVIIDTLVSNIRTSIDENSSQILLLKYLGMQLRVLKEVAYTLGAAVVVFNPISTIPEGIIITVPGGSMLSENMDIRILLKKVKGIENNIRIAELIQTPLTKEGSVRFMITEEGIKDV
ncbi:MAG: ATPase domain-containing protein [Thermoprotei archaeon]|jgi:DNA repair protein RadA